MELANTLRYCCTLWGFVIGLSATLLAVSCGALPGETRSLDATLLTLIDSDNQANADYANVVVLDWTGGTSRIYPNWVLSGTDLTAFPTDDGAVLADNAEDFQEAVRSKVAEILNSMANLTVEVRNGEGEPRRSDVTTVHLTQELSPSGNQGLGEGEFDPCNRQQDNAAVVFGEGLAQRGGAYTFDEWVLVFANVSAHEIGHTLGFGHVDRSELSDNERYLFVELMLDGHTMSELRREQRFVISQTNCPAGQAKTFGVETLTDNAEAENLIDHADRASRAVRSATVLQSN